MRRLITLIFLLVAPSHAFAVGAVVCGQYQDGNLTCVVSFNDSTEEEARADAHASCANSRAQGCRSYAYFSRACIAIAVINKQLITTHIANTEQAARAICDGKTNCEIIKTQCDTTDNSYLQYLELINFGAVGNGILFGLGIIIALLIYAKRASLANFIIHGNLPQKLPVYGEDIQCLFKRTQRINWYGRVIFGLVANLSMTHEHLLDVRKYWLGRVIAFDSLRRQRQNELARMHLQLAASAKSDPYDKKKFWSRRWATIRTFIRRLFWIFTALFSFLLSFLFIRVTLAKLIRGTVVESKDLVLILQAKDAIEESTTNLKEYLTTANTFDGRDEIYEPQ